MAYTETTTTSYGGRIGKALKGIVGGFIAFLAGTALLFWNEGNFIKTQKALREAQGATVVVESVESLDPQLNGKLIHASHKAETDDILVDNQFGVKENAIAIKRQVEFYQYEENASKEKRDKLGGGEEEITTYTYKLGWKSKAIDSSNFKDPDYRGRNYTLVNPTSQNVYAKSVKFGAYQLPEFFIQAIGGDEPAEVKLGEEQIAEIQKNAVRNLRGADANEAITPTLVHISENTIYIGANPTSPKVGDVRITLTKVLPKDVSLIGKVNGSTFGQFIAKNGKKVARLETGIVSAEEMFANAQAENTMLTWMLRLVGVLLVCGGLRGIFGILEALAKVVPFLGDVVGAGVGLVCTVVGVAWSLIWIAIGWVFYRPLVGIPLLIAAIALIVWIKKKGAKK